jgi:diguanylate cyclase (GGDEF)-like protein
MARGAEVVGGLRERTTRSRQVFAPAVEEIFLEAARTATEAVARWLGGESEEAARLAGIAAVERFAELAAQRTALLNEVTKRCLWWRDSVAEVLRDEAASRNVAPEALARCLELLARSSDVTLVRMCEAFENERQRMQEQVDSQRETLHFQATHDALTGLPNRLLVLDRAEQMLARARRDNLDNALLFIDLDSFKDVNDTLGHEAGDALLKAVGSRLAGILRATDTVGRIGGDEFVVLSEGISLAAGPELIAERVLDVLTEPFHLEGAGPHPITVTASVGIAVGLRESAHDLLRDGDVAMYAAKAAGKNRYAVFESEMHAAVRSRHELAMDLRAAIGTDQFFLLYQPTFDLREMNLTGVEALLRWRHPLRGVIGPDQFIPVLEESSMIIEVGRWVLGEACRQARVWQEQGQSLSVAVNVSGRQFTNPGLVDDVKNALESADLSPRSLIVEITETRLMADTALAVTQLEALRALGVRLAIDDFGTGYSSLAYLRQFPVDTIKIDRSFISEMASSSEGEALIHTLVQLGKALKLETLAEGIEERGQLTNLQAEQCDSGQGFLFARPLEPQEIERLFDPRAVENLAAT